MERANFKVVNIGSDDKNSETMACGRSDTNLQSRVNVKSGDSCSLQTNLNYVKQVDSVFPKHNLNKTCERVKHNLSLFLTAYEL